jgi:Ca2+-binding RTX toxin-like protein
LGELFGMSTRLVLTAVVASIAVLAIAGSAQASTCTYQSGAVSVYMPGASDGVTLHRVGDAIYNGGQQCGTATVYNTGIIVVNDTTSNRDGDDLVNIDLSGGPLAPGTVNEGPSGVSEIDIYLYVYQGTNTVLVTGSGGADNVHAGVTVQSGINVRAINLNAGAEQGKVSDADVTYQEGLAPNPPATEPIMFDGGEGDDTFGASGGAGFIDVSFQPVTLIGGNGNDHLLGGAGYDTLHADAGNDVLDGGQSVDTVTYQSAPGPASVDLSNGGPQNTGALGADQFTHVELLKGSPYDDVLTGSDVGNLIEGGGGNDVLTGRGENDKLDGGPGSDTASYHETPAGATQGVTVNLALAGAQNTGTAGSDTLTGIENLAGSPFADDLTGDAQPNTLTGWEGEDSLRGEGGDDHMAVRDGTRDLVLCGLGVDSVDADVQAVDSIFGDCEISDFAPFVPPSGGAPGGGSGAGTTGTASVGATAPAKASFAGSKSSIRVDRRGRFRFSFHAGPTLTGKARFKSVRKVALSRTSKATKRVLLTQRSFTAPPTGQVTLRMKLSRRSLRILKLNREIRTRLTVTLKNAAGLTSTASKRITLKAPKRPA